MRSYNSPPFGALRTSSMCSSLISRDAINIEFCICILLLFQESKNYSIPDPDMKTRIRLDLQNWIITLFSEFYSKMRTINFSSHQGKYMKLTPDDISEKIDRLFDTS